MKKYFLTMMMVCTTVAVQAQQKPAIPRDAALEAKIEKTLAKMTLDEKIGQMLELNLDVMGNMKVENAKIDREKVRSVMQQYGASDSDIKKISVDAIATKRIIDQLKKERQKLQDRIRAMTKQDNGVVLELHNYISAYAKEFDVTETYVSPNKDYIFTSDLKSLSGTILHKIVLSFKLAYIKLIKEKSGIVLPIVLDSPSGREVEYKTVENMLKLIQRDFPEHQLIGASIHDYDLSDKKIIEFKDRLFSHTDLMKVGN